MYAKALCNMEKFTKFVSKLALLNYDKVELKVKFLFKIDQKNKLKINKHIIDFSKKKQKKTKTLYLQSYVRIIQ